MFLLFKNRIQIDRPSSNNNQLNLSGINIFFFQLDMEDILYLR